MQEYNFDEMDWIEEEYDEDDFDEEIVIIRKRKRGRPKSAVPRRNKLTIRLTDEELGWMNFIMNYDGVSRSEALHNALKIGYNAAKYRKPE